jgi:hypothetical protein
MKRPKRIGLIPLTFNSNNMKYKLGLVVLIAWSTAAFCEDSTVKPVAQDFSAEWTKGHSEIRARIVGLEDKTQLIASFFKRARELTALKLKSKSKKLQDSYSQDMAKLYADVQKQVPDFDMLDYIEQPSTNEKDANGILREEFVERILRRALRRWDSYVPNACLGDAGSSAPSPNSVGCQHLRNMCTEYGYSSDGSGGLVMHSLESALSVKDFPLSKFDDELNVPGHVLYPSTGTPAGMEWRRTIFDGCSILSQSGNTFTSGNFIAYPDVSNFPKWANQFVIAYTPELFQEECIDGVATGDQEASLNALAEKYPGNKWPISYWQDGVKGRKKACNDQVQNLCANTYSIKGTRILQYVTVQCKMREVTAVDVENDVQYMPTQADKLEHSQLKDKIEVCDAAEKAGYSIVFVPTVVRNDCKPDK